MAGPWEQFQPAAQESAMPWEQFQPAVQAAPTQPISRMEKIVRGLRDPIDGGAQLATKLLPQFIVDAGNSANNWLADKTGLVSALPAGGVDQQVRDQDATYQAQRAAAGESGFDGYRTIGNIVNPANLAAASRLPAAASLAGRIGIGALAGGGMGALAPVGTGDFQDEKLKQIAGGAVVGGVVPAIGSGIARVISPKASTNPNLQLLRSEGVNPTVGQALGGRWNALEEKATSLPLMGDAISLARGRSLEDFNNAAINRATAPIGVQVDGSGQAAVRDAGDAISSAYNSALSKISGVKLDGQFNTDLMQLRGMAQSLTPTMRSKFNSTVNNVLVGRASGNGTLLPETYKRVDSELGQIAAQYGSSSTASEKELGSAVGQLQALLKQQMVRSNPQVADELGAADSAWANLVRIEGAAKSGKNAEGLFTPGQLNMAVQSADQSTRKRAVARGTALMQDLGNAGQAVLGNKIPNSFTADRAMIGAGGIGAGFVNPAIPAGLLGGAALYTPMAQRILSGAVSIRPPSAQPISNAVRQYSPALLPTGVQVGLGLLNNQ